jgi:hypothetical protein
MARSDCISRNSLLSRIRGSFVYSFDSFSTVPGTVIKLCEVNISRIFLCISIDTASDTLSISLDNPQTKIGIRLNPTVYRVWELSIDKQPGIVQASFFGLTTGMPANVSVVEILSGG